MARASIPVDFFNPGQVFACLGFLEAADQLLGNACGGFIWGTNEADLFYLSAAGNKEPIQAVLDCLSKAQVFSVAPRDTGLVTDKWGVSTKTIGSSKSFPIRLPESPEKLPAQIECQRFDDSINALVVDHWGDSTIRDSVKFWAGAGRLPGSVRLSRSLELVKNDLRNASHDPFGLARPQSSSLRFDFRRDYDPIDAGFSPNDHKASLTMIGFPVVEMMAAIGLSNARPMPVVGTRYKYRYSVIGPTDAETLIDPIFLRAALGGADFGLPKRDFVMSLAKPGDESKDRCITEVIEETNG